MRSPSVWGRLAALVSTMVVCSGVLLWSHSGTRGALDRRYAATHVEAELLMVRGEVLEFLRTRERATARLALSRVDAVRALLDGGEAGPGARDLGPLLWDYRANLEALVEAVVERGLDENRGAEGRFRDAAHAVEDLVQEARADALLVDLLTARRAEKDYIMRRHPRYVRRLHAAVQAAMGHAGDAPLSAEARAEIVSRLGVYRAGFDELVTLLDVVERRAAALDRSSREVSEEVANLISEANQHADDMKQAALLTLILTSLLGLALAVWATHGIVGPLGRMQTAAVQIAEGELDVSVDVEGGAELEALALALNAVSAHVEDRHRAQTELKEARTLLRTVIDSTDDGILVLDRQRRVVLANRRVLDVLGVDGGSVQGRSLDALVPTLGTSEAIERFERALAGERLFGPDRALELPGGERRLWYSASTGPLRGAAGDIRGVIVSLTDVTERKRHELELSTARERAERAARAKSRFLANMSHEIRTPLNGILGMASLLEQDELHASHREPVATIQASGEHLLAVINAILDYSKLDVGAMKLSPEPVDLRALLADVERMFSPVVAAKGLELRSEIDDEVPARILADKVRLQQILLNLVGNAVKFTDEGSVRVDALPIAAPADGDLLLAFEVRDTGCGIAPEDQARLFAPFEQVDDTSTRRAGGTGLGLAISKQLVQLMGGEIEVAARVGGGTTMRFTVRAGRVAQETALPRAVLSARRPVSSWLRVLVAEDNPVNQRVATRMLERLGLEAEVVDNGLEALEAVRNRGFDIVLMDAHMPIMNGLTACRRIRAEIPSDRQPRVVALTASAFEDDKRACMEAGMDDFVAKPVRFEDLERVLSATEPVVRGDQSAAARKSATRRSAQK